MSEKFKAIIIDNQNEKFSREVKEIDASHLKDLYQPFEKQ